MKGTFSYVISLFLHNEKNKILHQQFPAKNLTAVNLRYYSRSLLAKSDGYFNPTVFCLAILTTLCLQILSNLANELGDMQKGTDNADRLGPVRALQSGILTTKDFNG